jgi:hypothetical protein
LSLHKKLQVDVGVASGIAEDDEDPFDEEDDEDVA